MSCDSQTSNLRSGSNDLLEEHDCKVSGSTDCRSLLDNRMKNEPFSTHHFNGNHVVRVDVLSIHEVCDEVKQKSNRDKSLNKKFARSRVTLDDLERYLTKEDVFVAQILSGQNS